MSRLHRPRSAAALAAVALLLVAVSGCSTDDTASPSSTTTGIADPITTTTAADGSDGAAGGGEEGELPGLWLASPAGISDESGEVWASGRPGETLRAPTADGRGGVIYLRCSDGPTCQVENTTVAGNVPIILGRADALYGVGTRGGRRVLLSALTDPTIQPSFEEDRSGLVAQIIDLDLGGATVVPGWFGWESGPFVADVENDRFVVCFGEGESCSLSVGNDPVQLAPLDGVMAASVVALAIDPSIPRVTWIDMAPMTGDVTLHVLDENPESTSSALGAGSGAAPADEVATDGAWAAVRRGGEVTLTQLATTGPAGVASVTGTVTVPTDVTEMALRDAGGGGGAGLSL